MRMIVDFLVKILFLKDITKDPIIHSLILFLQNENKQKTALFGR